MEWNQQTLNFLSQCFLNTSSPISGLRRSAEDALSDAADRPNYTLAVLRLVVEPTVDEQIRHLAAVNFKNHLKTRWAPQPHDHAQFIVPDAEKEQIKSLIVALTVNSSPKIQSHLTEALVVIAERDFPKAWPTLLPEVVVTLHKLSQANDYVSVNGVLAMVNSLFKRFRHQRNTEAMLVDLKYCLDNFDKPLLEVFKRTAGFIDQTANMNALKGYIESQRLCCRIVYSLHFVDSPKFFEDHMDEWMTEFNKYLTVKYSALEDSGDDQDGLVLVDELRCAACENITLYVEKEEVAFSKYLSGCFEAVWGLLVAVSNSSSRRERLIVSAVKFLTTLSTSVSHHSLFARNDILQQICESVVIPNVMLSDDDEELFHVNYSEFIRRDMYLDTRRSLACDLLTGIAIYCKDMVIQKVRAQLQSLLASFAENPTANWKHKECAIYLVFSLATRTAVFTDQFDIESFFGSFIAPELRNNQDVVDGFPMLKAAALKFFTVFANQISKPVALALVPDLISFLRSESNVVHSYAADCIGALLLVKDDLGRARYAAADVVDSFLHPLLTNLFSALEKPKSEENQYVMECIMQVLEVASNPHEVALPYINSLATVLNRFCENPKNDPHFNRYMFESVSVLTRRACEQDPLLISAFETSILPSLQMILAREDVVTEFFPYAFHLLAQFVDLNQSPLPRNYIDMIFEILRRPECWKTSRNVQAHVRAHLRLLKAFLRKAPNESNPQDILSNVVGIFDMLVSSPSTEEQGFRVLNTVIKSLGYDDVISPFVSRVWAALFKRLRSKTRVKSLVTHMSLFLVKHGCSDENRASLMNNVQPCLFRTVLERFWIPNLEVITGSMEIKLPLGASARLVCELLSPSESKIWGQMLDSIVALLSRLDDDGVETDPEVPDSGYIAELVNLCNAAGKKEEEEPWREINDPKHFWVASFENL